MAAVAEFEARRIGQRVKEALASYKARGGKLGGQDPRCRGKRVFTSAEQRAYSARSRAVSTRRAEEFRASVRPVAIELRAAGYTLAEVAEEMTARGLKSRWGKKWSDQLVYLLLKQR